MSAHAEILARRVLKWLGEPTDGSSRVSLPARPTAKDVFVEGGLYREYGGERDWWVRVFAGEELVFHGTYSDDEGFEALVFVRGEWESYFDGA